MRREGPDAVRLSAVCGVAAVRRARPDSGPVALSQNAENGSKNGRRRVRYGDIELYLP